MSKKKRVYRIFYSSQDKGYEIYARNVEQGDIYGFIVIEDIIFGEKSEIVVDPNEDALKKEFSDVKRLMIPYHSVIRIDEVEKEGQTKIMVISAPSGKNADRLPTPPYGQGK